jgi:hypothetical protein
MIIAVRRRVAVSVRRADCRRTDRFWQAERPDDREAQRQIGDGDGDERRQERDALAQRSVAIDAPIHDDQQTERGERALLGQQRRRERQQRHGGPACSVADQCRGRRGDEQQRARRARRGSARPTMLVTASVWIGWTANSSAARRRGDQRAEQSSGQKEHRDRDQHVHW